MTPEPAAPHPLNRRRFTPDDLGAPAADSAASRALFAWYSPGFSDRLGDRLNLFDNTDGPPLELLRLRAEFSRVPDFEFSLRARASELRDFEHPRFARVCRVDRLPEPGGGLALVSVRSDGIRLSDVLRLAERRGARLSADLLLPLVADATDALAALHAKGSHVAHGAIGTDRLVIEPGGRLLVAEYVLGSALRSLSRPRADAWRQLRLALPADPATPAFTHSSDVLQLGLVALALASSRPIDADEDLDRLDGLLAEAARAVPGAGWDGRWPAFEAWLRRALHRDGSPFANAREAAAALAGVTSPRAGHPRPARGGWDQFVADCEAPPVLTGRSETMRPALGAPAASLDEWEFSSTPPPPADVAVPDPPPAPVAENVLPDAVPPAEHREWRPPRRAARAGWRPATLLIATALGLAILGGGVAIGARFFSTGRQEPQAGSIQIDSSPPVEMPAPASAAGTLRVTTEPSGLRVRVDGTLHGTSPLEITNLVAGSHLVTVERRGRTARQAVTVTGGATAALFVPLASPSSADPGWLSVASEVELQVHENGELLGTSRARIMLLAGRHEIDLVNEELGVRAREEVQVVPGGTAALEIDLPPGRLDVNALPWAEVWLDGQRLGETPLGAVPARIGRHVLTFRHPRLGERQVPCVVAAGRATRVGVDLRK